MSASILCAPAVAIKRTIQTLTPAGRGPGKANATCTVCLGHAQASAFPFHHSPPYSKPSTFLAWGCVSEFQHSWLERLHPAATDATPSTPRHTPLPAPRLLHPRRAQLSEQEAALHEQCRHWQVTLSAPHSVPSRGGSSLVLQEVSPSTRHQRPAHIRCCRENGKGVLLWWWLGWGGQPL